MKNKLQDEILQYSAKIRRNCWYNYVNIKSESASEPTNVTTDLTLVFWVRGKMVKSKVTQQTQLIIFERIRVPGTTICMFWTQNQNFFYSKKNNNPTVP